MVLLILLETRRRTESFLFNVRLFLILLGIECLLLGCSGACVSGASLTEYVLISAPGSVEALLNDNGGVVFWVAGLNSRWRHFRMIMEGSSGMGFGLMD